MSEREKKEVQREVERKREAKEMEKAIARANKIQNKLNASKKEPEETKNTLDTIQQI